MVGSGQPGGSKLYSANKRSYLKKNKKSVKRPKFKIYKKNSNPGTYDEDFNA